ncbi:MAG: hypothetical protein U1D55_11665 [Phycisphaerae bacterium]
MFERLVNSPVTQALELTARFAETQHRALAENVANIDTPGHPARQLDSDAFRKSLREAFARAGEGELALQSDDQTEVDAEGRVDFRPTHDVPSHVTFHDGTHANVERLMGEVSENALRYETATTLLKSRFDSMLTAIRGRTQ